MKTESKVKKTKHCENCGQEVEYDVRVCPKCGNDTQKSVAIQQTVVQPQQKRANGMAIAGLICAFLFQPLGLIFGIIGLVNSKKSGSGLGISIAAIIVSSLILILLVTIIQIALATFIPELLNELLNSIL